MESIKTNLVSNTTPTTSTVTTAATVKPAAPTKVTEAASNQFKAKDESKKPSGVSELNGFIPFDKRGDNLGSWDFGDGAPVEPPKLRVRRTKYAEDWHTTDELANVYLADFEKMEDLNAAAAQLGIRVPPNSDHKKS